MAPGCASHLLDGREEGAGGDALRQVGKEVLADEEDGPVGLVDALHRQHMRVVDAQEGGTGAGARDVGRVVEAAACTAAPLTRHCMPRALSCTSSSVPSPKSLLGAGRQPAHRMLASRSSYMRTSVASDSLGYTWEGWGPGAVEATPPFLQPMSGLPVPYHPHLCNHRLAIICETQRAFQEAPSPCEISFAGNIG